MRLEIPAQGKITGPIGVVVSMFMKNQNIFHTKHVAKVTHNPIIWKNTSKVHMQKLSCKLCDKSYAHDHNLKNPIKTFHQGTKISCNSRISHINWFYTNSLCIIFWSNFCGRIYFTSSFVLQSCNVTPLLVRLWSWIMV